MAATKTKESVMTGNAAPPRSGHELKQPDRATTRNVNIRRSPGPASTLAGSEHIVVEMHKTGCSPREIAESLHASRTAVMNTLNRCGVRMRTYTEGIANAAARGRMHSSYLGVPSLNDHEVRGEIAVLFVTNRKAERFEVIVDLRGLDMLKRNNRKVSVCRDRCTYYAHVTVNGFKTSVHKFLMGRLTASDSMEIDHLNGNGLDNRFENLRVVTHSENCLNLGGASRRSSSGVRGVFWSSAKKRWFVQIRVNGKRHHLGQFSDKNQACSCVARFLETRRIFSRDLNYAHLLVHGSSSSELLTDNTPATPTA